MNVQTSDSRKTLPMHPCICCQKASRINRDSGTKIDDAADDVGRARWTDKPSDRDGIA